MMRLAFLLVLCLSGFASAQDSAPPVRMPQNLATKSDVTSAIASSQTKLASVPASGPGVGLCRQSVVPSEMITSGGMAGQAGTCSRIVQCGTSANFVVTQFNVGGGC